MFRDVVLDGTTLPGSWIVKGFVRNNTGQDWKRVEFDFHVYDMTGSILKSQFIVHSLKDGDVQPFNTNYFKALFREDSLQSVWKYDVIYRETDLGKHRFIMIKPWESRELSFEDQSITILFSMSEK